jgi:hypothetical protein
MEAAGHGFGRWVLYGLEALSPGCMILVFHDAGCLVHHRGMARYREPRTRVASTDEGVGAGDLVSVRRALFMGALDVARADHDPSAEWEAFAEVAWREASLAFGFAAREVLPRLADQDAHAEGSGDAG